MTEKAMSFRLGTLYCHDPEDWQTDEVRIEVKVDGKAEDKILAWNGVRAGSVHFFGNVYHFDSTVELKIYDADWPDPDDIIAHFSIRSSNISLEFMDMNNGHFHYSLTWCNSTPHRDNIKGQHTTNVGNKPAKETLLTLLPESEHGQYKTLHESYYNMIKDKFSGSHHSFKNAVHTFKHSGATNNDKKKAIDMLKTALGISALQEKLAKDGNNDWGSFLILGLVTPVDFVFAEFVFGYGFAISTDPTKNEVQFLLEFDADLKTITPGDDGKLAIGFNKNTPENVPGFTWYFNIPANDKIPGGMCTHFDGVPTNIPPVQEIDYVFSPFEGPTSVGIAYTMGIGKYNFN